MPCGAFPRPAPPGFFSLLLLRPRCRLHSVVSCPGGPGPWRCVAPSPALPPWFFFLPLFAAARLVCCLFPPALALFWAAARCAVFFGAALCVLCCAVGCCFVLRCVSGRFVRLRCSRCGLLSGFGPRCHVLCCAASLGAVRRRVNACCSARRCAVLCCVVLFCSFGAAACCLVPYGAARPPGVVCLPVLCFVLFPVCCVCSVVVCWCVLLFATVLCAVCVLGRPAVRPLSPLLCAVLCCVVLVRLRCAVRVVCAVSGAWCCGALLCVVLFPVVLCGVVLGVVARGCLLVACFGSGVPVWPRGLLPFGWCGLLWCPAPMSRVFWCCAVVLCRAVVWCCAVFSGAICACLFFFPLKTASKTVNPPPLLK